MSGRPGRTVYGTLFLRAMGGVVVQLRDRDIWLAGGAEIDKMKLETIRYEKDGPIIKLTFDRPQAFNALSYQTCVDLFEAISACEVDREARAVLLTGSGEKAFCAGGDVPGFVENLGDIHRHLKKMTAPLHAAISRMIRMEKPVVAAINGVAAGAGLSLSLAPDLAIAAESARFNMAYTGIGASPDGGSTFLLPRAVGLRRAMELALLNRVLSSKEALDWGLINRVVPDAQLAEEGRALAMRLAEGPTLAYGRAKELLAMSFHNSLEAQMEDESQAIASMGDTADFREGITAFVEKRKPAFKGK